MGVSIKKVQINIPETDLVLQQSKPILNGGKSEYFIITKFDQENWTFFLICTDDSKAYSGEVSERYLRLMAAESPVATFDLYLKDAECAFGCRESSDEQNLHYFLKTAAGTVLFEWKKDITQGMRVQLGELEVQEKDFNTALGEVFCMASLDLIESKQKISELDAEVEKKEREKTATQSVLDETLQMKSNLETDLFTKFAKVLNSKKEKIRELYLEIESLKRPQKSKKGATGQKSVNGCHSKDADVEMLDEDVDRPGPSRKQKMNSQDSLLLSSDEEEKNTKPVTKPRQRVRQQSKFQKVGNEGNTLVRTSRSSKKTVVEESCEDIDGLLCDL